MKTLKVIFLVISLLAVSNYNHAQEIHKSSEKGKSTLGVGVGFPYGAIGARFGVNVIDHLTIFGGVGYQLSGVGYNFGLLKDFKSKTATQFYLTGMYGTNAAIKIDGLSEYDKVYTGATFGLGIKINSKRKEGNFWDVGLLLPIRSSSYKNDERQVENDPRISEFTKAWPIGITIGYNFGL
ncbi:hypothetical protein ABW636_07105 [Aquimarina sp. 2201CG1-2-11]|uniref:hypothetical protein n=1 Tax=Aquimarina discodermiae TaxID=3231043 RepID=UPI003462471C